MYSLFIKMSTKYIKPLFKATQDQKPLLLMNIFFISNDDFSLKDNVTG